jgi:auxin responsive GH3 family protein/jasmonic acid-amino synthetase
MHVKSPHLVTDRRRSNDQHHERRAFPVEDGKALQFIYGSRQFTTTGGLTATTATTNVYRSEEFMPTMRAIQSQVCSPEAVIFGADFAQSLYCHLLCGLLYADEVRIVSATFAHSLVLAFQTFERVWEDLCADIRAGSLSQTRVTAPAVRRAVEALLTGPNPALADEVVRRCAGLSNWYGVIPALFPNARYVHGIMTGSMEHYVKKLRHYAGGLPLVAAEYGASEGWVGANVEPETPPESVTFTVLPNIAYFEFIPLKATSCCHGGADDDDTSYAEAEPVGLTEVAVGEHYEVVVTTFAGNTTLHTSSLGLGPCSRSYTTYDDDDAWSLITTVLYACSSPDFQILTYRISSLDSPLNRSSCACIEQYNPGQFQETVHCRNEKYCGWAGLDVRQI